MDSRWKSLDTLKGIAIFSVVLFHVGGTFSGAFSGALDVFYRWGGYFGNYLFFMISGLCISAGYQNRIAAHEAGFLPFMKRRLIRLYPLYFLTELLCFIFQVGYGKLDCLHPREIIRNLLCITYGWVGNSYPYNFPCWFLSVLLQLYIIHFAVLWFFRGKAPYIFALLAVWGVVILKAGLQAPFCYAQNGEGLSNYFIGCLLFELLSRTDRKYRRAGEGIAGGLLAICILRAVQTCFSGTVSALRDGLTFLICPLLILAVIDCAPVKRALEQPGVYRAFGKVSMYIFFWHIPVLQFYINLFGRFSWYQNMSAGGQLMGYLALLYAFCQVCVLLAPVLRRIYFPSEAETKPPV